MYVRSHRPISFTDVCDCIMIMLTRPLYVALARFGLAAHGLAVVQGRRTRPQIPYLLRTCSLEGEISPFYQEVQDEVHAMYLCQFAPAIELRQLFAGLFESVPQHSDDLHDISPMLWSRHPLFLNC